LETGQYWTKTRAEVVPSYFLTHSVGYGISTYYRVPTHLTPVTATTTSVPRCPGAEIANVTQ